MKVVPKTILKPEVLAFFLIEIGGMIIPKLPQAVSVVNLEMRSITFSFIRSALRLLDLGRITLERNKPTLCEMLEASRRGTRTHVRSNGAAFCIQGFFSGIHSRYVANARNKLPHHCTNWIARWRSYRSGSGSGTGTGTSGATTSMGTTNITSTSSLGARLLGRRCCSTDLICL